MLLFLVQIAFGRIQSTAKGNRTIDLFIQTTDGKKIIDDENIKSLCSRLKEEMLHPLRVTVGSRGPDTELLVANPVELCGKGRPRVFYDVTIALKELGICVFSVSSHILKFSSIHVSTSMALTDTHLCRLKLQDIQQQRGNGKFIGSDWMKAPRTH